MLLLRNGEMLRGKVTRVDDRYRVVFRGGEILVKAGDVQSQCRDGGEAYAQKRALIRPDVAQDHLDLAQWCQKCGLLAEAAGELAEAAVLDPTHPMIPLVQRRLQMAKDPQQTAEPTGKSAIPGPSVHDLDRMVRGMPPKSVETFAQVVQPMLLNHCATSGCHGQRAGDQFHLLRAPAGTPPSRRLTQRNLYATLQWIDHDNPGRSRLLTIPTRPHGTAPSPIFSNHQTAQFRQLVDWCYRASQAESPVVSVSYEEPVAATAGERGSAKSARTSLRVERMQTREQASRASKKRPAEPLDVAPAGRVPPAKENGRTGKPLPGGTSGRRVPADPFDAEVFNRQFAPAGGSQSSRAEADGPTAPLPEETLPPEPPAPRAPSDRAP